MTALSKFVSIRDWKLRVINIIKRKGFTLIEVMITVTIIGILLAVALPAYGDYVKDGRRAEAQQYLMQQAGILERNYTRLGRYPNEQNITFKASDYYAYSYKPENDTEFLLTAAPKGAQVGDKCGSLSINQQGVTSAALTSCWQ
uniref:type IV pilin protein n=1 Tax=Pseudoalteromonas sp. G4 TaxID=2992761 RepID=UPI00237E1C82|nr:type IV pilin protein [Pseudoalteromonas sp. G4]